jgi:hypothetical protein
MERRPELIISGNQFNRPLTENDVTWHAPSIAWCDEHFRLPDYNPSLGRWRHLDSDEITPKSQGPMIVAVILNSEHQLERWISVDGRPLGKVDDLPTASNEHDFPQTGKTLCGKKSLG